MFIKGAYPGQEVKVCRFRMVFRDGEMDRRSLLVLDRKYNMDEPSDNVLAVLCGER